jgi:hypothetical protein
MSSGDGVCDAAVLVKPDALDSGGKTCAGTASGAKRSATTRLYCDAVSRTAGAGGTGEPLPVLPPLPPDPLDAGSPTDSLPWHPQSPAAASTSTARRARVCPWFRMGPPTWSQLAPRRCRHGRLGTLRQGPELPRGPARLRELSRSRKAAQPPPAGAPGGGAAAGKGPSGGAQSTSTGNPTAAATCPLAGRR